MPSEKSYTICFTKVDIPKDKTESSLTEAMFSVMTPFLDDIAKELDTQPSLPLDGISTAVHIRNHQLAHLITELVGNAIDAVAGNDAPLVEVSLTIGEDSIFVTITDNGIGFPVEVINQFREGETIVSSKSVTHAVGGAGAGLMQIRDALTEQSGSVSIINRGSSSGSQVTLTLDSSK